MPLGVIFSVLSTLVLLYLGYFHNENQAVEAWLFGNRGNVYGTLASLFGTMFGFTITTTSLCLNLTDKPRFQVLRTTRAYRKLWSYFIWAIVVLGLSVLVTLLALVVDRSSAPVLPLFYIVTLFLLLSTCFLGNCIYALKLIIDVASQEPVGRPGGRENTSPNLVEVPDKDG
jgi:hypothetical protein